MIYIFVIILVSVVLYAALAGLEVFLEYRLELKRLDQKFKEVIEDVKN